MPKKYSNSLKRQVLQHYHLNRSISDVSTIYNVPKKTIEKWITKYRREGEYAFNDVYIDKDKEIDNLNKKIKSLEHTIELLKKICAFFTANQMTKNI